MDRVLNLYVEFKASSQTFPDQGSDLLSQALSAPTGDVCLFLSFLIATIMIIACIFLSIKKSNMLHLSRGGGTQK